MTDDDMLDHAERCERLAEILRTPEARKVMLAVAARWRHSGTMVPVGDARPKPAASFNQYASGLNGGISAARTKV